MRALQLNNLQWISQHGRRSFSTLTGISAENIAQTTNNFIVLQPDPASENVAPRLQLRFNGPVIELKNDMTLKDLADKLKAVGEAKNIVDFLSNDGSKLANSSTLKNVLEMPNFKMNIDQSI